MKKLLLVCLAVPLLAVASPKNEPLYVSPPHPMNEGDGAPADHMRQVIFTQRKCELPIVNAEHMRAYTYNALGGMSMKGCAGRTLNNDFLTIYIYQGQAIEQVMPRAMFKTGTLGADGIVTISNKTP